MRVIVQPKSSSMNVDFYELDGRRLNYKIKNECTRLSMSFAQKGYLDAWETLHPLQSAM